MADMTATTMATYLPEQWSTLASITYRSNVILPDLMDRRWEPEIGVGDGDTVNIPNFSQNSSATKRSTFGTGASLTFTAVQEAQTQLAVNQMAYKAYRMPVEMNVQTAAIYEPLLTDGIGQAIALQVDSELGSDNSNGIDGFTTNVVGTDNIDVTYDDLVTCETNINNVNAPMEGRSLVISPATRGSLMGIEAIRNQLYSGSVGNITEHGPGFLGTILSWNVYMSNNLEAGTAGKKNGAFQQEAIAFAMQKGITLVEGVNIADGIFREVAGYAVYGHKMVKETFGNELDGK